MLLHLPGGQAYLDAAAAAAAGTSTSQFTDERELLVMAGSCCAAVHHMLALDIVTPADRQQSPLLSAAAVRLALELQLLAAAEHQRRQQQDGLLPALATSLVMQSTRMLHVLIRAVAQAEGGCLPAEVLQQAGLQLLQALAAPLQQLQLSSDGRLLANMRSRHLGQMQGELDDACHVLVAAACGPALEGVDGELPGCQSTMICVVLCG
jgi:hypothetical protein